MSMRPLSRTTTATVGAIAILVSSACTFVGDEGSSAANPAPAAFTACVEHYGRDHDVNLGDRTAACQPFLEADREDGEGLRRLAEVHFGE